MAVKTTRFISASAQLPQLKQGPGGVFMSSQFHTKADLPPKSTNLTGQTGVITGSNTGIGFTCADMLLGLGLTHLILGVRTKSKGEAAAKQLREKRKSPSITIDVFLVDLESYDSIQDFVRRCAALPRIDFVILNAGATDDTFSLVKATGHERLVQVNFISTMLLATLLLPVLKSQSPAGRPGRLTIVSSGLSLHAKFPQHAAPRILPAFDFEKDFDALDQYSTSKFLLHLYLDELVQHVDADDVVVNCVDPGLVKGTNLHRDLGSFTHLVMSAIKSVSGRSLEAGASTYINAAVVQGKETHGCFVMNWKIFPHGMFFYGPQREDTQARLWEEMMEEFRFLKLEEVIQSLRGA
ncbi:hypothetical protein F5X68DRAFT_278478 [Plectosphaerella plurivora]|uniref:Uncharacterized protein n=1 Tax=Plectosphaerella plurivora TaxID=936078 RepID=A0A9P9A8K9_9PEZI|nr:hypothetical protein F5X68DRAFT_278478 [Plectosphaerella plurivora]